MKTNTKIALLAAALSVSLIGPAQAAQPKNTIRFGAYIVQYDAQASDIIGPYAPSGLNIGVKDVNTVYLSYTRRLSEHFAVELAAGIPPKTRTVGRGPAQLGSVPYNGQIVATSKWFSPTLLLLYRFGSESQAFRPYVGLGTTYTHFLDNTSAPEGNAVDGGPTSISLSDSLGLAATVGFSYNLNPQWGIYASYSVSHVESNMTANTAGVLRRTTVNFRPSAYVLSVGYSF